MSEDTPETDTVRYYAMYGNGLTAIEFNRWLATIQADAYDHGVRSWGELMIRRSELQNPYRENADG